MSCNFSVGGQLLRQCFALEDDDEGNFLEQVRSQDETRIM
jgi:hypothetical protein